MEQPDNAPTLCDRRQIALFEQFNEHLRATETKYLGIFLAYLAGAGGVIAARPPSGNTVQLELWQLLLVLVFGFVALTLMLKYRKSPYHHEIRRFLDIWNVHQHPFQPTGGDDVLLYAVGASLVVAVL